MNTAAALHAVVNRRRRLRDAEETTRPATEPLTGAIQQLPLPESSHPSRNSTGRIHRGHVVVGDTAREDPATGPLLHFTRTAGQATGTRTRTRRWNGNETQHKQQQTKPLHESPDR